MKEGQKEQNSDAVYIFTWIKEDDLFFSLMY